MESKTPKTPREWLDEIQRAIASAAEVPFGQLLHEPDKAVNLFHLTPIICLKFRGLNHRDGKLLQLLTERSLANYVVNSDPEGVDHGLEQRPLLAFATSWPILSLI
jgi:hypothetical protein